MEDDDIETSSSGSLVLVALAVFAIVLGGAGLYFGLTANQRISPLTDSMEAGSSSAARLEKDIAGFETKLAELSAQSTELKRTLERVKGYGTTTERAVKAVASSVKENRDEIVKLASRLNEVVTAGVKSAPVAITAATTTTATADSPAATGASPSGTYTIASGDTFAKVAGKLGVSLQALLDANPDADPRRLAIGQVIKVPTN